MASANLATIPTGLTIDYIQTVGPGYSTPATFSAGTTYFVSGPVYCGSVVMESAVFKYPNSTGNGAVTAFIEVSGALTLKTSSYCPAIFTAGDDDSVGLTLDGTWNNYSGMTAGAWYANPSLNLTYNSASLSNMRFLYCQEAVKAGGTQTSAFTIKHAQFVDCLRAIKLEGGSGCGCGCCGTFLTGENILMAQVQYPITSSLPFTHSASFYHCTVDGTTTPPSQLITETGSYGAFTFVNSIVANISIQTSGCAACLGNNLGFWNCPTAVQFGNTASRTVAPASPSPFQVVDFGAHYLSGNSPFRTQGTTSIPSGLLSDLKGRTTSPPISLMPQMSLSGQLTFFPQTPRYISGSPDLGYYYDVLDFTSGGMVVEGATITVLPGTAIGLRTDFYVGHGHYQPWIYYLGFDVWEGSQFISQGTPTSPITYASARYVQEGPYPWYVGDEYSLLAFDLDFVQQPSGDPSPILDFRFSNFYFFKEDYAFCGGQAEYEPIEFSYDSSATLNLQDCSLHGGGVNLGYPGYTYDQSGNPVYWTGLAGTLGWTNNLFESVDCNLTPSDDNAIWHWQPYPVSMTFYGNNNLLRNCRLRLSAATGAGVNWALRDNLFDKVTFQQDTATPLDHDHNGYWPCNSDELDPPDPNGPPNNTQLVADSGGATLPSTDVVLHSAPPYQSSTFGNYYLPTNTTLWSAGSQAPANVGLFHYTTRANQVKEGDETGGHMVNIGLHYVAANASGNPQDYDLDGIPDYVEDSNGNGSYDQVLETDWTHSQTVPGTADSLNSVYDNADLDGDAMVGSVEKLLGKQPLVSDSPLTLSQLITGAEPDVVTLSVPISYSLVSSIGGLTLLVDGQAPTFQECDENSDGTCLLAWSPTFNWPGQHYLQAELVLNPASLPNYAVLTAPGPVAPFYASTGCQFDPVSTEFDDTGASLVAYLPEDSAQYSVEIRTPSGGHIRTISGTAGGGQINTSWDLMYDDGVTRFTGDSADAVFTITPLPPAAPNATVDTLHLDNPHVDSIEGNFTVAYTWDNTYEANNHMRWAVQYGAVDILLTPQTWPNGASWYYSDWNTYTYNGQLGATGYLSTQADANNLINNLVLDATRNFFFSGHGNQYQLSDGPRGQVTVMQGIVSGRLGNSFSGQGHAYRNHPYRFVFLDSCQGADDAGFAHAFGIFDRLSSAQIDAAPQKAQAFLSWVYEPRAPIFDNEWDDENSTYSVFFSAWMSGYALDECINYASVEYPPSPFLNYILYFPLGIKFTITQPKPPAGNSFHLRIYGYAGITRTGYKPGFDQSFYYR